MDIKELLLGYKNFPTSEELSTLSYDKQEEVVKNIIDNISSYSQKTNAKGFFQLAYLVKEPDFDFHFEVRSLLEEKPDYPIEELFLTHSSNWFIQELRERCFLGLDFILSDEMPVFSAMEESLLRLSKKGQLNDTSLVEIVNLYSDKNMTIHEIRLMLEFFNTYGIENFEYKSILAQLKTKVIRNPDQKILEVPTTVVFDMLKTQLVPLKKMDVNLIDNFIFNHREEMTLEEIWLTLDLLSKQGIENFYLAPLIAQIDTALNV